MIAKPKIDEQEMIHFSLPAILAEFPEGFAKVESSVPGNTRISVPFHLVEPQLANGTVAIPANKFLQWLPDVAKVRLRDEGAPVPIPLHEVFLNLPGDAHLPEPKAESAPAQQVEVKPSPAPEPEAAVPAEPVSAEPPLSETSVPPEPKESEPPAPVESLPDAAEENPPSSPEQVEAATSGPLEAANVKTEAPIPQTEVQTPLAAAPEIPRAPVEPLDLVVSADAKRDEPVQELPPPSCDEPAPVVEKESVTKSPLPPLGEVVPPTDKAMPDPPVLTESRESSGKELALDEQQPSSGTKGLQPFASSPVMEWSYLRASGPSSTPVVLAPPPGYVPPQTAPASDAAQSPSPAEPLGMQIFARPPGTMFLVPPPPLFVGLPQRAEPAAIPVQARVEEPNLQLRATPPSDQTALQAIFMTEDELDLGKIAALVCALPGVNACVLASGASTATGGSVPPELALGTVGEASAKMFEMAADFAKRLSLGGSPRSCTLQGSDYMATFFVQQHVCLCVFHRGTRGFFPGVREKLVAAAAEIARIF